MEDWRVIAFAVFLVVIIAAGWVLRQRKLKAEKTGADPVYGIASLDSDPAGGEGTSNR